MSRLIDADVEIQKINQEIERYKTKLERLKARKSKEPHNIYHDWNSEIKQVEHDIALCKYEIAVLNLCPTAYSVEKVVEQMKDYASYLDDDNDADVVADVLINIVKGAVKDDGNNVLSV